MSSQHNTAIARCRTLNHNRLMPQFTEQAGPQILCTSRDERHFESQEHAGR